VSGLLFHDNTTAFTGFERLPQPRSGPDYPGYSDDSTCRGHF
jgi:hypothetical protein